MNLAHMNLAMFFEGTGQGVAGKITNVTRLKDLCVEDERQRVHLEPGPGTHFGAYFFGKVCGADCRVILRSARRWFQQNYRTLPSTDVYLFGFSRGALLARRFAEWLEKINVSVQYLGIWDTVDSALKIDVSEACPKSVRYARHAVARDERRRYFKLLPLRLSAPRAGEERVFPGVHSDIGGLYEDNHDIADATLTWIAESAVERGLRLKPDATLPRRLDLSKLPTHDSFRLLSNLWGLLGSSRRTFTSCRLSGASSSALHPIEPRKTGTAGNVKTMG